MSVLISVLLENWQALAAGILAVLGFLAGTRRQKNKQIIQKAKARDETHKRINKNDPVDPDNHDDVVERLRKLGQ